MKGLIRLDVLITMCVVMGMILLIPLLPKLFELAVSLGISIGARL